jgi:hypothetical protein
MKVIFVTKFFDPLNSEPENKSEYAQKVPRNAPIEQGGIGTESGDLHLDH